MGVMRWLLGPPPERPRSVLDRDPPTPPAKGAIPHAEWMAGMSQARLIDALNNSNAENRAVAEAEIAMRHIKALEESAYQQSVSSARLERLTLWLVFLTIAIVALTVVLLIVG
jgi:hypothetical protein